MSHHENLPYLKHIIDAINDTEESVKNLSKTDFKNSKDIKDAAVRRIEIIGEAAKNISDELKKIYPEIEWKKIMGARDVMIHAYFNVDLDVVWDIIKKDLPILKKQILKIKDDLGLNHKNQI